MDAGLILQLRRALEVVDQDLARLTSTLATLADKHRATPIAARTWMQQALPTTFGFIVAGWLDAVLRHRARLAELRAGNLPVQLGGAVGTLAALPSRGPGVAKALAEGLRLPLPSIPWHTHRDRITEIAAALGLCVGTLGKIARDVSLHAQTEIAELAEPAGEGRGGSSTMPQKRNPVTCATVLAAAQSVPGLVSTMLSSMVQEQERGLSSWQAEWETLPEIVCLSGGALHHLAELLPHLHVDAQRMLSDVDSTDELIFAEASGTTPWVRTGKSRPSPRPFARAALRRPRPRPIQRNARTLHHRTTRRRRRATPRRSETRPRSFLRPLHGRHDRNVPWGGTRLAIAQTRSLQYRRENPHSRRLERAHHCRATGRDESRCRRSDRSLADGCVSLSAPG